MVHIKHTYVIYICNVNQYIGIKYYSYNLSHIRVMYGFLFLNYNNTILYNNTSESGCRAQNKRNM